MIAAPIVGHATLEAGDVTAVEEVRPANQRWWWWPLMLIFAVLTLVAILGNERQDFGIGWSMRYWLVAAMYMIIALGVARFLTSHDTAEEVMARIGLMSRVMTVEVHRGGIVYCSLPKRDWNEFRHFAEGERAFALHLSGQLFYVIPKRAFTLEDLANVRELLDTNIQRR